MTALSSSGSDRIAVGRIVRPVGVRGELKVLPLTDDAERFSGAAVMLIGRRPEDALPMRIERMREQGNAIVLKLAGVDTIEAAEGYRDRFIYVEAGTARKPRDGSYLVDEIIGCLVVTEAGREVGTVADVLTMPAQDLWVVRDGAKEYLLPAVRALLRKVDVAQKRIEVVDLGGLFE